MLKKKHLSNNHLSRGLEILYEDRDILVVDKPAGLLTVGTETNKFKTVYYILSEYVCKGCQKSRNRIFIVHRLDQWTSGVLIFAKSEEVKLHLQDHWREDTEKKYIAVVYGHLTPKEGIITSYLAENKAYVVYSTTDITKGKLAHTAYKVIKETKQFSLLEINLLTGRKNQIRVHMADKGHPIVGDRKYGKIKDEYSRLALHSKWISFKHPFSGKKMAFEAKVPDYFNTLIPNL
ncbi:MAG TPA: RNA pseudouridine synthase [Lentisphaeria bacterium]|nr:MAG: RNA pseudouridine synthase [Lentisphaerae bacterium GWF2_38_69]HBM15799.1 RNA pseudouridine synthase [Lentisphaeria bacterium]